MLSLPTDLAKRDLLDSSEIAFRIINRTDPEIILFPITLWSCKIAIHRSARNRKSKIDAILLSIARRDIASHQIKDHNPIRNPGLRITRRNTSIWRISWDERIDQWVRRRRKLEYTSGENRCRAIIEAREKRGIHIPSQKLLRKKCTPNSFRDRMMIYPAKRSGREIPRKRRIISNKIIN